MYIYLHNTLLYISLFTKMVASKEKIHTYKKYTINKNESRNKEN